MTIYASIIEWKHQNIQHLAPLKTTQTTYAIPSNNMNRKLHYPLTACANIFAARSLNNLAFSACGNSWNTSYTLFPFASLTAPSLLPATAPATAPVKLATIKPSAPPDWPPIIDQNLLVGRACGPSAMPSSLNISSN